MLILGDPPQRAPGGRIEQEQERDEEQQQEITDRGCRREDHGVVGREVEEEREEEEVKSVDAALKWGEDEGVIMGG